MNKLIIILICSLIFLYQWGTFMLDGSLHLSLLDGKSMYIDIISSMIGAKWSIIFAIMGLAFFIAGVSLKKRDELEEHKPTVNIMCISYIVLSFISLI